MNNNWKDIYFTETDGRIWDYRGIYQINEEGIIKALPIIKKGRNNYFKTKEHFITQRLVGNTNRDTPNLYYGVSLVNNKVNKQHRLHRILAFMFLEKIEGKDFINHIDGNKLNNNLNNLEWVTTKENSDHKFNILKYKMPTGIDNKLSIKIDQYSLDGKLIKTWDCMNDITRELKLSNSHICSCCKGRYKSLGGFIWQYNSNKNIPTYTVNKNSKKIDQYSLDGKFIKTWDSAVTAAKDLNINQSKISLVCLGKRKQTGGFIWKFTK